MNITAIQTTTATNTAKTKHILKIKNTKQYSPSKELYPLYYLPLSFKGSLDKSKEMLILENRLKKFCEENKEKELAYIDVDIYPFQLTNSKIINTHFIEMIKETIETEKRNKKLNKDIIKNAIEKGLESYYKRINNIKDYKGYYSAEIINEKKQKEASRIINLIKDTNFDVEESSEEYFNIRALILKEIHEIEPEVEKEIREFVFRNFLETFGNEIKNKSIKPILDDKLVQKLQDKLKQEPYVSFNAKMLRVESQEKASTISANECAENLYNDVLNKNTAPFDNPQLYKYLKNHDENLDFLIEKIYGYHCDYVNNEFEKSGIDQKHKILLVDPAIHLNFDKLIEFVKNNSINTEDIEPIELRKAFSDYLGTETVYRGLYSQNPEALIKSLKEKGNPAHIFTDKENAIEAIKYYISNEDGYDTTFLGRIMNKIKRPNLPNEYISATSIYDIAASVPKMSGNPNSPVVVIKTEVPKLSLIKQKGLVSNMQSSAMHRYLTIGRNSYSYDKEQDKIEIFVPFYLPTDNAEYTIDTHTPNFVWTNW